MNLVNWPEGIDITEKFNQCLAIGNFDALLCNNYSSGRMKSAQNSLASCLQSVLGTECQLYEVLTSTAVSKYS